MRGKNHKIGLRNTKNSSSVKQNASLAECKRLIAQSEQTEKPTISYHWKENGMSKTATKSKRVRYNPSASDYANAIIFVKKLDNQPLPVHRLNEFERGLVQSYKRFFSISAQSAGDYVYLKNFDAAYNFFEKKRVTEFKKEWSRNPKNKPYYNKRDLQNFAAVLFGYTQDVYKNLSKEDLETLVKDGLKKTNQSLINSLHGHSKRFQDILLTLHSNKNPSDELKELAKAELSQTDKEREVLEQLLENPTTSRREIRANASDYYIHISQTIQKYLRDGKTKTALNYLKKNKIMLSKDEIFELTNRINKYLQNPVKANAYKLSENFDTKLDDLAKMFQGKVTKAKNSVLSSDVQPARTARIGNLTRVLVDNPNGKQTDFSFDGESFLSMDRRKNLWISGKDSIIEIPKKNLPADNELKFIGWLNTINYVTGKAHIENGRTTEFYHRLGEVDKETPTVWIDADGFLIIIGGNYDIWKEGIVN